MHEQKPDSVLGASCRASIDGRDGKHSAEVCRVLKLSVMLGNSEFKKGKTSPTPPTYTPARWLIAVLPLRPREGIYTISLRDASNGEHKMHLDG